MIPQEKSLPYNGKSAIIVPYFHGNTWEKRFWRGVWHTSCTGCKCLLIRCRRAPGPGPAEMPGYRSEGSFQRRRRPIGTILATNISEGWSPNVRPVYPPRGSVGRPGVSAKLLSSTAYFHFRRKGENRFATEELDRLKGRRASLMRKEEIRRNEKSASRCFRHRSFDAGYRGDVLRE